MRKIGMIGIILIGLIASTGVVSASGTCGDVNKDGSMNVLDVICIMNYIGNPNFPLDKWAADVNCDRDVNVLDVILIMNNFGTPNLLSCCDKAQYYNSIPLTNNYEVLQYVKYCDDTNENTYVPGQYECFSFTIDLVEALRAKNVPAHYMRYIDPVTGGHVPVLIDFPYENPMVIEPQTDNDDTDKYDTDGDGIVEYRAEVNFARPWLAYFYIKYRTDGYMPIFYSNRQPAAWATDDGDMVVDMNYC